jgi:hypothetical protein
VFQSGTLVKIGKGNSDRRGVVLCRGRRICGAARPVRTFAGIISWPAHFGIVMIFVHKKSSTPIMHWDAIRHGGANNLGAGIRGKYLLLWNADIVQREGAWHYIFEFDVRESLEISALAQLTGKGTRYPDDMDWKGWLGGEFQVINAAVREAILTMPADEARTGAIITGVRENRAARPIPHAGPGPYHVDPPRGEMLAWPEA